MFFATTPSQHSDESEVLLLARSLRRNGGLLVDAPLWIMVAERPGGDAPALPVSTAAELRALDAELLPFEAPPWAFDFFFALKAFAAAEAERLAVSLSASDSTLPSRGIEKGVGGEALVWLDPDTLILRDPSPLHLPPEKWLGCCPVQLKNISSLWDEALDAYWQRVYTLAGAAELPPLFPLTTTVDGVRIRPHFNAGLLVVRPESSLLRAWAEAFERLHADPAVEEFYARHILYRIFIHQAALAGAVVRKLAGDPLDEILLYSQLDPGVNYPAFLEEKMVAQGHPPPDPQAVITLRYDELAWLESEAGAPWRKML